MNTLTHEDWWQHWSRRAKSNREIAEALVLSERTVEGHVGNILNKLGFTSRAQIAAWAVQKGLVRS